MCVSMTENRNRRMQYKCIRLLINEMAMILMATDNDEMEKVSQDCENFVWFQ